MERGRYQALSRMVVLVVAALVCLAVGFVAGQWVQAANNNPGSDADPLVTKSYVEEQIGGRMAQLQTQIDELEAEISALKSGGTPIVSGTGTGSNSGTTTGSGTTEPTTPTVSGKKIEVTVDSGNVRAEASQDSAKLASVKKGDKFDVLAEKDGWYQIKIDSTKTGWIKGTLVKVLE